MKLKKRISRLMSLIMLITVMYIPIDAQVSVPTVEYNGKKITYNDTYGYPFIDENDRTQVPFRRTLEAIGASVSWNAKKQMASAVKDGIRVDVPIGEMYIYKNGEKILNDTKSGIIDDRTYLPIRVVLEAFGSTVTWNQSEQKVVVSYQGETNLFTRIPAKYDLRNHKKVTPIKNQFDTGACWAFASLGALESALLPGETWDFSEDHLSLGHGYNLSQAKGGNYMIALSYLTRWSGPVLEKEDPFNDKRTNPNASVMKHLQEAQFIPAKDYAGIKVAIMNHGGVQSSMHVSDLTFTSSTDFYNPDTASYYYNGNKTINHDVVLIGWDDNYPKENFNIQPRRNGAFLAKNSYGTAFGQEGYFYISYEDIQIGTLNIVYTRIDPVDNYDKIYQADWLGFIGQIGYGEETAYFSNVYETQGIENLKAVSFYATDEMSAYEVYVVNNFESKDSFNAMRLIKRGTKEYGGYYTIDFETPIRVNGRYAVVVKITTPNSEYPVAAEFKKDNSWISTVNLDDGEGYMSYDGIKWDDVEETLSANISLKAFTNSIE